MKKLQELLSEYVEISDYKITTSRVESSQLFFCHRNLETVRKNDVTETRATIYVLHDGKIGESQFQVYVSNTEEEIRTKITQAIEKAKLIFNEIYELPKKEVGVYELTSNFQDEPLSNIAKKTADAVFDADVYENGSINALEIFVNKKTFHILNSQGIDKTQISYKAMIEAIPTWNGKDQSVELYMQHHFGVFDAGKITSKVKEQMEAVKARYEAIKPTNISSIDVILQAPGLSSLISSITSDLSFSSIYSHTNLHNVGDSIQSSDSCDKLSVTLRGQLEGSTGSSYFDGQGTNLVDRVILEDGVAIASYGGSRFAQYLHEIPTGDLRCMEVKPGCTTECELKTKPYLECVSLSGIQVDLFSDYIGGEIRLGYYFDGKKLTPVTGITMSGKLSDALNSIKLSKETILEGSYFGPKVAKIENMIIA